MATVSKIVIDDEIYQLPRPLEVGEDPDRKNVLKTLINAWKEDYEKIEKEFQKPKMFYKMLKEFVNETEINIEHHNEDEFARPIDKQELKIKLEAYKHVLNMFKDNFPEVLKNDRN